MDRELLDELLPSVKLHCGITWDDEKTNEDVAEKTASAWAWLEDKLGAGENEAYFTPGNRRELLMERVRYARAGALDVWANNYRSLILDEQHRLQIDGRLEDGNA